MRFPNYGLPNILHSDNGLNILIGSLKLLNNNQNEKNFTLAVPVLKCNKTQFQQQ